MEIHRYEIRTSSRKFRILPVGDLQIGSHGFRDDLWQRWYREALADKDAYIIGMGDYSDAFRPTIMKKMEKIWEGDEGSQFQQEEMVLKSMQKLADKLKPLKHRIIGLLEGHHKYNMRNGGTTTNYLCQLLGVRFLGLECMVQLAIERSGRDREIVEIYATHGCGGSKFTHSDLSNLERNIMPFWDADIYLRGHSTKVAVVPGAPLVKIAKFHGGQPQRFVKRHRLLVQTGGFMEGRVLGQSSYVEEKGLPSCALGWSVIDVHLRNTQDDGKNSVPLEITGTPIIPY